MDRTQIFIVSGLVLGAFGAGVGFGSRLGRNPGASSPRVTMISRSVPLPEEQSTNSSSACVDIRNAAPLVGKKGCVAGLVMRAFSARSGNTFLDFCQDYRDCPFTSVIFAPDKDKFGNLESLQGKRVEIRGDVVSYQDRAEIIIRDPEQLRSAP
jgi:hypothetical protein